MISYFLVQDIRQNYLLFPFAAAEPGEWSSQQTTMAGMIELSKTGNKFIGIYRQRKINPPDELEWIWSVVVIANGEMKTVYYGETWMDAYRQMPFVLAAHQMFSNHHVIALRTWSSWLNRAYGLYPPNNETNDWFDMTAVVELIRRDDGD